MSPIHILFAKSDSVLALGVMKILQAEKDFLLTEPPLNPDGSLHIDTENSQPDVIILEVGTNASQRSQLHHISRSYPGTAIITLHSAENWIKFVNKQESIITEPAHLVAAVRAAKKRKEGG